MTNNIGANRLERFPEYPYAKLHRMKEEIEVKDKCCVLDLSIGSPTFPPLGEYMNKLSEFISHDKSHLYPSSGAIPELKEALKNWYKRRFNVILEDNELYPLIGAKDGVSHIPLALLNEGDEILIPDPGYPGFTGPVNMIEAIPVYYQLPKKNGLLLNQIESKVTNRTKAIWVNSPGNPTGYICSRKDLSQLVEFALAKRIIILYDNAYSEITFDGIVAPSILEIDRAREIAIEIGSFSKTFSFAGFRMAWMVGNEDVIWAVSKVESQMDSGLMHPFQLLGAYAPNNFNDEWHSQMVEFYKKNRDRLIQVFKDLGLEVVSPDGALYLWIKIPDGYSDGYEYTQYLLAEHHIPVTPGSVFGPSGKKYIRASYSSDLQNM